MTDDAKPQALARPMIAQDLDRAGKGQLVYVGRDGEGTLDLAASAELYVTGSLWLGAQGILAAESGSTIRSTSRVSRGS